MIFPIQNISNTDGFKSGFSAIRESVSDKETLTPPIAGAKDILSEALFQRIEDISLSHLIKRSQEANLEAQVDEFEKIFSVSSDNSIVSSLFEAKNAEAKRLQEILSQREQTAKLLGRFEQGFTDTQIDTIEEKIKELPKTAQERKDLISDITNLRLASIDNLAVIEDYSKRIDRAAAKAALQRFEAQTDAQIKAELAQKYYASIVENHANKSAIDSAKVFEESFAPETTKRFNQALTTIKDFAKKHKLIAAFSVTLPFAFGVFYNRAKKTKN